MKHSLINFYEFFCFVAEQGIITNGDLSHTNDDRILYWAKSLKSSCMPILLTNDYNLQAKALASRVKLINPSEYFENKF